MIYSVDSDGKVAGKPWAAIEYVHVEPVPSLPSFDLAVAGVKLRLWWRVSEFRLWLREGDHTSVYVRACGSACQEFDPRQSPGWRPLGMTPLRSALG